MTRKNLMIGITALGLVLVLAGKKVIDCKRTRV
ncbi:hypothetical protein DES33_11029 [Finegoldia magna]|nr:hypothetical protein DES33_11029 [Finegoldia magna]